MMYVLPESRIIWTGEPTENQAVHRPPDNLSVTTTPGFVPSSVANSMPSSVLMARNVSRWANRPAERRVSTTALWLIGALRWVRSAGGAAAVGGSAVAGVGDGSCAGVSVPHPARTTAAKATAAKTQDWRFIGRPPTAGCRTAGAERHRNRR